MKGNIDNEQLQETREFIGAWLRDKREANELSQTELAEMMGVRQETVSKVEAGKWAISVDMLSLFCFHLNYPLKKLFNEKVPVRPRSRK